MAQRVFWNYQEALNSFDFGKMMAGLFFPGRYTGFDTKSYASLVLSLTHAATGIEQSDASGVLTNKTGVWVSAQGAVIQENATVSIGSVAANSSGNPRIDLIIGDYLKPVSATAAATYALVTGTPGAIPAAPANPDPTRKTILGYLLVPDGTTTDLSGCTYTKADIPLIGGEARPVYSGTTLQTLTGNWKGLDGVATTLTVTKNLLGATLIQFSDDVRNIVGTTGEIMLLPSGYRPTQITYVPVITSEVAGTNLAQCRLKILTTGRITVEGQVNNLDTLVYLRGLLITLA